MTSEFRYHMWVLLPLDFYSAPTCYKMQSHLSTRSVNILLPPRQSSSRSIRYSVIYCQRARGFSYSQYALVFYSCSLVDSSFHQAMDRVRVSPHVCSQFLMETTSMLDLLEDFMELRKIPFARLDGSTCRPLSER